MQNVQVGWKENWPYGENYDGALLTALKQSFILTVRPNISALAGTKHTEQILFPLKDVIFSLSCQTSY